MQDSSAGANAKQQIVDRIKQSTNILITVNSNPSVDALSALLAFSLMLNKMDKHATSVFSGVVPPAINFLEPAKSFENNVDSLRDFIIALDKEKADRLRYKVENDVVKIFITPYKTTITQNDLQFSQGDFNVDLIIALGVEKREELDKAIVAHGRILHDAAVMTINAANQKSSLGSVDWQDSNASSLCEMITGIGDSLQSNLLDQQMSTALLTGIVAATERFSNQHTTPNVMTIAAKLMAAGANQQLIATNLATQTQVAAVKKGQAVELPADVSAKVGAQKTPNGEMHIKHEEEQKPEVAPQAASQTKPQPEEIVAEPEIPVAPPAAASFDELKQAISEDTKQQNAITEPESVSDKDTINASQPARKEVKPPKKEGESYITSKPSWMGRNIQPPTLGGTLSATAQEALENKMRDEADARNRTLLSHDEQLNAQTQPATQEPKVEAQPQEIIQSAPVAEPVQPEVQVPAPEQAVQSQPVAEPVPAPVMDSVTLQTEPSLEELEAQAKTHAAEIAQKPAELDAAREAVDAALAAAPPQPNEANQSLGAQEFPPAVQSTIPEPTMADAKQLDNQISGLTLPPLQPVDQPPVAVAQPQQSVSAMPAQQTDLPPLPPLPPMPDFSTLPPAPVVDQMPQLTPQPQAVQSQPTVAESEMQMPATEPTSTSTPAPVSNDPAQYRIPGAL